MENEAKGSKIAVILGNVAIIAFIIIGVIFSILMNRMAGTYQKGYDPSIDAYVYKYDVGFRPSVLFGVAGVFLFEVALFMMVNCRKEWKFLTWSSGWIFFYDICFKDLIVSMSKARWSLILDNWYEWNTTVFGIVYDNLDWIMGLVTLYLGIAYVMHWTGVFDIGVTRRMLRRAKIRNIVSAIAITVIGIATLIVTCFTNPWYLITCAVSSLIYWFGLTFVGKLWIRYGATHKIDTNSSLFEKVMRILGLLNDEDDDEFIDDDYEENYIEMTEEDGSKSVLRILDISAAEFILDSLTNYVRNLEYKPLDDKKKKELLVEKIYSLKNVYEKSLGGKKARVNAYFADAKDADNESADAKDADNESADVKDAEFKGSDAGKLDNEIISAEYEDSTVGPETDDAQNISDVKGEEYNFDVYDAVKKDK